jgi:thymidylate synthase
MSSADTTYLALLTRVLETGTVRKGRNGDTLSLFGERIEFSDIAAEFPLLTTKRVYWKGIIEELLWFLSGSTDVSKLRARDVHIWDGNSTREYLDGLGLTTYTEHEEGGPIYGFQWRHFGATYVDCKTDYTGHGVDQIAQLVVNIKANPASRRHLLSAWNPPQLDAMILPPEYAICRFVPRSTLQYRKHSNPLTSYCSCYRINATTSDSCNW